MEYEKPLGGILVFSGFFFPITKQHKGNQHTRILIQHGELDTIIPWEKSKQTYALLDEGEHKIQWHIFEHLDHEFYEESYIVAQDFLHDLYKSKN